jgi:hypothetical protein
MTTNEINQIIDIQGVYKICYFENNRYNIYYASLIEYVKNSKNQKIIAYCYTEYRNNYPGKDIEFEIKNIMYAEPYWIGILTPNDIAPKDGIYIILCCEYSQGIDQYYKARILKNGDSLLTGRHDNCEPIAFHYIPHYNENLEEWNLNFKPYRQGYGPKDINVFWHIDSNNYYYLFGDDAVWDCCNCTFIDIRNNSLFRYEFWDLSWDPKLIITGHYQYNHFCDCMDHRWIKILVEKRRKNEPNFLWD